MLYFPLFNPVSVECHRLMTLLLRHLYLCDLFILERQGKRMSAVSQTCSLKTYSFHSMTWNRGYYSQQDRGCCSSHEPYIPAEFTPGRKNDAFTILLIFFFFLRKCVGMAPDHAVCSLLSQCAPDFFILFTLHHTPLSLQVFPPSPAP